MKVIVHPAAANELKDAAAFYAAKTHEQLGLALVAEFKRVVMLVSEYPTSGSEWVAGTRRFVMRRFPFNVVYRLFPDHLFIVSVAHQRRRPGYWRDRK